MSFTPAPILIQKASVLNTPAVQSVDILGADIAPSNSPSTFRITVALSGADSFLNMLADDGTNEHSVALNDNVQLVANTLYTFSYSVISDMTYNFQVASLGTSVYQLLVEEVVGGVI